MKTIILLVASIIISCTKDQVSKVDSNDASSYVVKDSRLDRLTIVTFSKNIKPTGSPIFDSLHHRLLIDSFTTSSDIIIDRVTFTVNDYGSITKDLRLLIDDVLIDSLYTESRYQYFTRYFDFVRCNDDTIRAGKHRIKFSGTSYPQYDSLNIFYSVYQGDFVAHNSLGGSAVCYGLPLIMLKRHNTGAFPDNEFE